MSKVLKNRSQRKLEQRQISREKKRIEKLDRDYTAVRALFAKGFIDKACEKLKSVFEANQDNPFSLHQFGLLALNNAQYDWSAKIYKTLLKLDEESQVYLNNYAMSLSHGKKDTNLTREVFEKALSIHENDPMLLLNYSDFFKFNNQNEKALELIEMANTFGPNNSNVIERLVELNLLLGEANKAYDYCKSLLDSNPKNTMALSYLQICYSELSMNKELDSLFSQDWVKAYDSEEFWGKDFNDEFISNMTNYLIKHPSMINEQDYFSTKNGRQTFGNLLLHEADMTFQLEHLLGWVSGEYIKFVSSQKSDHPHCSNIPKNYRISSWAVELSKGGYQDSHIHSDGWMSSVFYLSLPKKIDPSTNESKLLFGNAPKKFYHKSKPQTFMITPNVGSIIMFPSFYWHETISFETDEKRLSISFDGIEC